MARFQRSSYTFDKTNTNYINAICKYNANVFIEKLNGRDVSKENYRGKDLPAVIAKTRAEEFNIEIVSGNASSTVGVIPAIDKDRLLTAVPELLTERDHDEAEKNFTKIADFFQSLIRRGGFEVMIWPPDDLVSLTQSQAILLLDMLQKKFEVTGAMLLPEHNAILLQFNRDNYILRYGPKTSLKEMAMLQFDIDDGFCTSRYDLQGEDKEIDKSVYYRLQGLFQKWKGNNYDGELIPAALSGFKYGQVPAERVSVALTDTVNTQSSAPVPAAPAARMSDADKMRQQLEQQEQMLSEMQSLDPASLLGQFSFLGSTATVNAAAAQSDKDGLSLSK